MERRLAAILAADVVGYSRLMEQDEAGTFERLRSHRKELFKPEIEKHHGRVFKLMGDGLLAEFGSVVDAVECAVALQRRMAERNSGLSENQRIDSRIGVHLGDVIVEDDDRYGDAVNVAARLQQLAEAGGICVSETVVNHVRHKVALRFEPRGEERLKNIAEPVSVFRVETNTSASDKRTGPTRTRMRKRRGAVALFLAILSLAIIGGAMEWWHPWESKYEPASPAKMALPLPGKPSIAVLPFTNMSSEAGQEDFADGMTDDVITDLSKSSALFVIARNSTFVYKGKAVKISEVAEALGVRYVLEGSVQRAGDKMRVNAQLIDALTGGHVWAERFDGKVDDIFALQDVFVRKIVDALKVQLTKGEIEEIDRGKTDDIAAKEVFDAGWKLYSNFNAKDNVAAIGLFKRAIEIDPEYGRAYAALALAHFHIADYYWNQEMQSNANDAYDAATHYLELAEKYPTALARVAQANVDVFRGNAEDAVRNAGLAIALDPNDPEAHIEMALALTISGKPSEALSFVDSATRLNPNYPSHYVLARGLALLTANDLAQAATILNEGFKRNPQAIELLVPLASALAQLGRREEAGQALRAWRPQWTQGIPADFWDGFEFPIRWESEYASVRERLYDGLRVASLPPSVTVSSLVTELQQESPFRRQAAAKKLGWFGPAAAEAVPALIKAIGDEAVRNEAVRSLGKIGPAAKAAIPALEALQDESIVGAYAKDALNNIRGN